MKVLVIFPDEWISYSPSILNLIRCLSARNGVKVELICCSNRRYPLHLNEIPCHTHVITVPRLLMGALSVAGLHNQLKIHLLTKKAQYIEADVVIGVDLLGVKAGLNISDTVHLFCLELEQDRFYKEPDSYKIASVAIQTKERYQHLFGDRSNKVFYIQNAPDYVDGDIPYATRDARAPLKLICFGNLIPRHGIFQCIAALSAIDDAELTLTGRMPPEVNRELGTKYKSLIEQNRLIINKTYIPQSEVLAYLRQFHIGFCFYDFKLICANDFNYLSSPSGKIFNYFASGVPVVGNDILGLKAVTEHDAGVLLKDVNPDSIRQAISHIDADFRRYRANAIRAAKEFSFSRSATPYIDYLLKDGSSH